MLLCNWEAHQSFSSRFALYQRTCQTVHQISPPPPPPKPASETMIQLSYQSGPLIMLCLFHVGVRTARRSSINSCNFRVKKAHSVILGKLAPKTLPDAVRSSFFFIYLFFYCRSVTENVRLLSGCNLEVTQPHDLQKLILEPENEADIYHFFRA